MSASVLLEFVASVPRVLIVVATTFTLTISGCTTIEPVGIPGVLEPSNFKNWQPSLAVLPYATSDGQHVTVRHVRNCDYKSEYDYTVNLYDRTLDLKDLQTVDFIVVPFRDHPYLAHTMLSFGLGNDEYLCVSAEVRLEEGEKYSPIRGLFRQYELTYVVADERDLIRLRTRHRDADVYIYRTIATPEQSQDLFLDVIQRINKLAVSPEFYDAVTNNCTTNIVNHVNRLRPHRVPYAMPVLLPGYADRYAYSLGLLDTKLSLEQTRRLAHVNQMAELYYDSPEFSKKIRR